MTESIISSVTAVEEYSKLTTETEATDTTSWRPTDVKHKKNEVYVGVVETVYVCMSAEGDVLRADVDGHIFLTAYLSGTPECKFVLNDRSVSGPDVKGAGLCDYRFHQCVHLNEFDAKRAISFVPPDGEFQLMSYRCTSNVSLPIKVSAQVADVGTNGVSYAITIKANFPANHSTSSLVVKIPTPLNTTSVECRFPSGKAKYVPEESLVVWKIPKMQGGSEMALSALATLTPTTVKQVWATPPIEVDFQIKGYMASGLTAQYLRVTEDSNYESAKWVRYLTEANGSYQARF